MTTRRTPLILARGRRGLPGETGAPGASATALEARLNAIDNMETTSQVLYIHASTGSDLNDGNVISAPLASLEKAVEQANPFGSTTIVLLSDITISKRIPLEKSYGRFNIRGRNSTNTNWQRRKITSVDSVNVSSRPGAFVILIPTTIALEYVDVESTSSRGWAIFEVANPGMLILHINQMDFTQSGGGNAKLIVQTFGFAFLGAAATVFPPGELFNGVGSGVNPNSRFGIVSNITSG